MGSNSAEGHRMSDHFNIEPAPERRGPGRPSKAESSAPRQAMRQETTERSIRDDIPRAPDGMVRQRRGAIDPFELPEQIKARFEEAGWSLEWKRYTCYGQSDISYENALAENHWEPVVTDEVPGFMPKGYTGAIIRDGLMLMKRPAYLTEEARREDIRAARELILTKEEQLGQTPPGTLTRDHPTARPRVGKSFEPMEVPND